VVKLIEPGDCLVEKVVNELLNIEDLSLAHVIIPTKRLATFICLRLAQLKGTTWYPTFYSIEEFVNQHSESSMATIDAMSSELVLGGILHEIPWKFLRPGLERELLVFFNSAIESETDVFKSIQDVLAAEVYRSAVGAQRLDSINNEISECLQMFESRLKDAGMLLPVRQIKCAVQEFLKVDVSRQNIILAGFTTIRPVLVPALKHLGSSSQILMNTPFQMSSQISPLLEILKHLGHSFDPKPLRINSKINLFESKDVTSEIELIINGIQELLRQGVKPSSIGVLIADEARYGTILETVLKKEKIHANISLPVSLGRTPLGELFRSVADFSPEDASILQLALLAMHPLVAEDEKMTISQALSLEDDFHVKVNYAKSLDFWQKKLQSVCQLFGLKLGDRPLKEWVEFMKVLLEELKAPEIESEKDKKASMREASRTIILALSKTAQMIHHNFSSMEFWTLVTSKVLSSEVRTVGYPLEGVQILSIKEARHIPFDYVFIPGMLEGSFPAKLPKDTLIEDWLKKKANIPSWNYIEAMEDTTFGLLLERIPSLCLSWPMNIDGQEVVRSRFVERLKAMGTNFQSYLGGPFFVLGSAKPAPAPKILAVENDLAKSEMKPSTIEKLLACPWQYYLNSRELKVWQLGELDYDFLSEGQWIHKVVELFFESKADSKGFAKEETEDQIKEQLSQMALTQRLQFQVSESFYLQMSLKGWGELATHIKKLFVGWLGGQREKRLPSGTSIELSDFLIPVRGQVDAIEKFPWGEVIIDYKRSAVPSASEVTTGQKPQLPIYAALLGKSDCVLMYWRLKTSKLFVVASSVQPSSEWTELLGNIADKKTPTECYEKFKEHLEWRLSEPKVEPDLGKVCDRCDYANSCRRDDPRFFTKLSEQARWEKRIKETARSNLKTKKTTIEIPTDQDNQNS